MAFSLKAVFGLDTTKFERGIDKARSKLASSVGGMMRSLAPIAGFIGFTSLGSKAMSLAREITNLSKVAGATPVEFQRMAFAAKTLNVEQEKLADILKDTSDKIGDFIQTGGGPMADFFENIGPKVGVTADMFRELSGPDALQLYYDSIEKANLSQNEMTFYMEAIASDATLLIPLLKDSGKGFSELGDQAERAGLIMSDFEREKLKEANLKIDVMSKRLTILSGSVLSKVIPAIDLLKNGIAFLGDIFGSVGAVVVQWGKGLADVGKAVIQPAISQFNALRLVMQGIRQALAGNFDAAKESARAAKAEIASIGDEVKNIPKVMSQAAEDLKNTMQNAWTVIGDSAESRSKDVINAIDDIIGKNDELNDAIANTIIDGGGSTPSAAPKGDKGGLGALKEKEQRLKEMRLQLYKAEARGQQDLADQMRERIRLAEKMLQVIKETGATDKEALIIANDQIEREKLKSKAAESIGGPSDALSASKSMAFASAGQAAIRMAGTSFKRKEIDPSIEKQEQMVSTLKKIEKALTEDTI